MAINAQIEAVIKPGAENSFADVIRVTQALSDSYGRCITERKEAFMKWLPSFFAGLKTLVTEKEWLSFDKPFCHIINKTIAENPSASKKEEREQLKRIDTIQVLAKKRFTKLNPKVDPITLTFTPKSKEGQPASLDEAEDENSSQKIETIIPKLAALQSDSWKRLLEKKDFSKVAAPESESLKGLREKTHFSEAESGEIDLSDFSSREVFENVMAFLEDDGCRVVEITLENCIEILHFAQAHGFSTLSDRVASFLLSKFQEEDEIPVEARSKALSDAVQHFIASYSHIAGPLSPKELVFFEAFFRREHSLLTEDDFYAYIGIANKAAPCIKQFLTKKLIDWYVPRTPDHSPANLQKRTAFVYFRLFDQERAKIHFEKALKLDPSRIDAIHYTCIGQVYAHFKKYEEAIKYFKTAETLDPSSFDRTDYCYFGEAYFFTSDFENSKKYYKKSFDLAPNSLVAEDHWNFGLAYFELKEWENAKKHLEKAFELKSKMFDEEALAMLAEVRAKCS